MYSVRILHGLLFEVRHVAPLRKEKLATPRHERTATVARGPFLLLLNVLVTVVRYL